MAERVGFESAVKPSFNNLQGTAGTVRQLKGTGKEANGSQTDRGPRLTTTREIAGQSRTLALSLGYFHDPLTYKTATRTRWGGEARLSDCLRTVPKN